jgi:hypothetical protein
MVLPNLVALVHGDVGVVQDLVESSTTRVEALPTLV